MQEGSLIPFVLKAIRPEVAQAPTPTTIVKYRDRSIVKYDKVNDTFELSTIAPSAPPAEPCFPRTGGGAFPSECPLCGQQVNLDSLSYEARTYFRLLQGAYKRWRESHNHSPRDHHASPSRNVLPNDSDGNNPFTSGSTDDDSIPKHLLVDHYYDTFFVETKLLGRGAFGQVYLCLHRLDDLVLGSYAVKKIPVGNSRPWLHKVIREVKMREGLNHYNIVSYKHSWLEVIKGTAINAQPVPWLFVLMEYCNGDDLEAFVMKNSHLPNEIVWTLFIDILHGLQHLHHAGVIHRDLKPSNIMLKIENDLAIGGDAAHALLADFGTAEYVNSIRSGLGFTGTVEYTAPELLEQDETGRYTGQYDYKSDMWSLGWILYFLAYGSLPFGDDEDPERVRVKLLQFKNKISQDPLLPERDIPFEKISAIERPVIMKQVIAALLHPDPDSRPSCDFLCGHEHIKDVLKALKMDVRVDIAAHANSSSG